ncbi:ankyrin repeat domain-containing protein [Aquimarina spongiae]|uniref:Ankyrin repeat n=1 Tax=Aquimarina spongiae TaxID=570521 RepID=A0A1M6IZY2_9FLAO|nr:ankyrin repeat domain-containing protein [Aquimarina spongiae]SHJ39969.1 Ankyrin repeat [Aquimarina spongiae]
MKRMLCITLFFVAGIALAQDANVFLNRAYWKTNPSIAEIEQKIKEGNDIAELNQHYFDAVSWALIEKVDNSTIKHLLSKQGNDVNKLTHDGRTYIFWAAYKNNLEMMQFLVDKGAKTDIIDSHGYSLANFAAVTGQLNTNLYDFCIQHGARIDQEKNNDGASALLLVAPFITDYSLIDYFTAKGIDLHSTDNSGNGIFNYASKKGNTKLLDYLIRKGVTFKGLNKENGNAMLFASQATRGHANTIEVYTYLENLGVSPNVTDKNGVTPLHILAAKSKDKEILNYFIDKGITINAQDGKGKSVLTYAIERNSNEIVQFLMDKGANVSITDQKGNTLAYYLINSYNPKKQDDFDRKMEILTKKGLVLTKGQGNGNTLFHLALDKKNIDLLKKVNALDIDVNAKNKDGITALHKAAMTSKDDKILTYLLSIGADKSIKTDFEESALDLARENELLQENTLVLNLLK